MTAYQQLSRMDQRRHRWSVELETLVYSHFDQVLHEVHLQNLSCPHCHSQQLVPVYLLRFLLILLFFILFRLLCSLEFAFLAAEVPKLHYWNWFMILFVQPLLYYLYQQEKWYFYIISLVTMSSFSYLGALMLYFWGLMNQLTNLSEYLHLQQTLGYLSNFLHVPVPE